MGVLDYTSGMLHRVRGQRRDEDPYDPNSPYGPATPPFNPYAGGGAPSDVNPTVTSTPTGGFDERLSRVKRVAGSIANPGDEVARVREAYGEEFNALGDPPQKKHRLLKAIGAGAAMLTPVTGMFASAIYDGGYSRKLGEYAAREKNLMDRYAADMDTLQATLPTYTEEQAKIYGEGMKPQVNTRTTFDPYSGTHQTLMDKDDRLVGADGATIASNPAPAATPKSTVHWDPKGGRAAIAGPDGVEFQEFDSPAPASKFSSAPGIGIYNQGTGEVVHEAPSRPVPPDSGPSTSTLGGEMDEGDQVINQLQTWISRETANTTKLLGTLADNPEQGYQAAKQTAERIGSRVESTRRQMQARATLHKQSGQPQLAAAIEAQMKALPDAQAYHDWAESLKPEPEGPSLWDQLWPFGGDDDPEVVEDPDMPSTRMMTREEFVEDFLDEEGRAPTAEELAHFQGKVWQ